MECTLPKVASLPAEQFECGTYLHVACLQDSTRHEWSVGNERFEIEILWTCQSVHQ